MDTSWISPPRYPLLLFCTVYALLGHWSPVAAAGRSCADTRQVYAEKGYSTSTAPLTQISGKIPHLACGGDTIICRADAGKPFKFKLIN